jgi:4-aminobutyrate aminotransferase-like enzyme
MVVMGKPMGNGHPMGAVITRREIADLFANGMEFFSTFGGNPVSCAMGMAVLDAIEEEGLREHAREIGKRILAGLHDLKGRHEIIGDARGVGLFIGIELVLDRDTQTPADQKARELVNRLKNRGILLGTDGPFNNVVKIKPPMVITREDADMFVRILDDCLTDMEVSG